MSVMMRGFGGERDIVVRRESSSHRMQQACCGVVVGLIFFAIGLVVIVWNEYRTVQTGKAIALGEEAMVEGACDTLDASLAGALVFIACDLSSTSGAALASHATAFVTAAWRRSPVDAPVVAPTAEVGTIWATSAYR